MKIFIFLVFLLLIPATTLANNLIFVEVKLRGLTADESFITIFNQGETIDVSGFRIRKRTATGRESSIRVFPRGSIIPAQEYFTWANSKQDYHLQVSADVWSTAGLSNNNSIALFTKDGQQLDSLAWGEGKNQFLLGSPLPDNPAKEQIIKRVRTELGYQNTKNNAQDFYFYPKKEIDIPQSDQLKIIKQVGTPNSSVWVGLGVAISSALSILLLKRSLV